VCVGRFENIPLGTVYAEDEDDWDVNDKTFSFAADNDMQYFKYVRCCSIQQRTLIQGLDIVLILNCYVYF